VTRRTRIAFALALLFAGVVAWPFGRSLYWRAYPEAAYRSVTGAQLPPGVTATAYRTSMNDNLLHITHYWLLSGEPQSIRAVVESAPFARSDEDARAGLPAAAELFGARTFTLVAGYEWEAPRNHWYYIFEGEADALYEY
jgi:hypothetical protein